MGEARDIEVGTRGDPLIGARLGKYEILALLGAGGMGRVYEARNVIIGKHVAIKVLADDSRPSAEAAARFQREARAASAADSPYIVEIFDAGSTEDGRPYIVMELLRGESLGRVVATKGKLPSDEVLRIATHVLRGLERAHAEGIVHRDLKPDNIFLEDRAPDPPLAKILDFGVSKIHGPSKDTTITREGAVVGTPRYMSPEQTQGEGDIDARSDLWSLGAIVYECLAGRPAFAGATYLQVVVRICTTDPVALGTLAPDCSVLLTELVAKCLQRDPAQRFQSASEALVALGQQPTPPAQRRPVLVHARDSTTAGAASTIENGDTSLGGVRAWAVALVGLALVGVGLVVSVTGVRERARSPEAAPSTLPSEDVSATAAASVATSSTTAPAEAPSASSVENSSAEPASEPSAARSDETPRSRPTPLTPRPPAGSPAANAAPGSASPAAGGAPSARPQRGVATSLTLQEE